MGNCGGGETLSPEDKEAKARSKEIEKLLKEEKRQMDMEVKLLLLGSGESGKTTVLFFVFCFFFCFLFCFFLFSFFVFFFVFFLFRRDLFITERKSFFFFDFLKQKQPNKQQQQITKQMKILYMDGFADEERQAYAFLLIYFFIY